MFFVLLIHFFGKVFTMCRNAGIDYGMGKTNIDHKTGIRYGVISQYDITQAWGDSSEADYGKPSEYDIVCPTCQHRVTVPKAKAKSLDYGDTLYCRKCREWFDLELPDCAEPIGFYVDDGEYKATSCLDSDVMILSSPYYTLGEFCSPCVPGAVNLNSPNDHGAKAYCFGHDWFDEGIAPYPVFRVSDNVQLVATRQAIACPNCAGTGKDTLERIAKARGVTLDTALADTSLMNHLQSLSYNPSTQSFYCWRCNGIGTINEIVIAERVAD